MEHEKVLAVLAGVCVLCSESNVVGETQDISANAPCIYQEIPYSGVLLLAGEIGCAGYG